MNSYPGRGRAPFTRLTPLDFKPKAQICRIICHPKNNGMQDTLCHHKQNWQCQKISELVLANKIVNSIVDDQGYNNPQSLSCLDKKGIEQLQSVIHKSGGMKSGTQNSGINISLCFQGIIMVACFALNHQCCCSHQYRLSCSLLDDLDELCLQQVIEVPTPKRLLVIIDPNSIQRTML